METKTFENGSRKTTQLLKSSRMGVVKFSAAVLIEFLLNSLFTHLESVTSIILPATRISPRGFTPHEGPAELFRLRVSHMNLYPPRQCIRSTSTYTLHEGFYFLHSSGFVDYLSHAIGELQGSYRVKSSSIHHTPAGITLVSPNAGSYRHVAFYDGIPLRNRSSIEEQ